MNKLLCTLVVFTLLVSACTATPTTQGSRAAIDHVAMSVANATVTAQFYKELFGLAELKNPFPGGGGVVWLDLGNGTALHIFGGRKASVANERERHLAITVKDINQVTSYLRSHGLAWQDFDGAADRVQTRPDGVQQLFFQDPDGYWVEVNDALKLSK